MRFLEDATEKDLWVQFKKWGDVQEIFISKQRNKRGRRYGFVRFRGVSDVRKLERKLDNPIVDGLKLYVNVPKYERGKGRQAQRRTESKVQRDGGSMFVPFRCLGRQWFTEFSSSLHPL